MCAGFKQLTKDTKLQYQLEEVCSYSAHQHHCFLFCL